MWVGHGSIQYLFNRVDPPSPIESYSFNQDDYSSLAKTVFDQATARAPNPNVPALDTALLESISNWRRILRAETVTDITDDAIATLFNAIIFARAIEDLSRNTNTRTEVPSIHDYTRSHNLGIVEAIAKSLVEHIRSPVSTEFFDRSKLAPFESLSQSMSRSLASSFYGHPAIPYDYDFSVISKHALSRIYERYVSVMQDDDSVQFSMFPSSREEAWNKQLGGIYTPQYIAGFFARYLQSQMSNEQFIRSSVADPACGSGIFLRTVMEQKMHGGEINASEWPIGRDTHLGLSSLLGIDVDENAAAASRLSLALLHLARYGELPDEVPVHVANSIQLFAPESVSQESCFDAVIVNPPFVRTELQSEQMRLDIAKHVEFLAKGKVDSYLAFLVFSIRLLRPGGFGCFVLPQPILTSAALGRLRDWIRDECWIRVVADLSAIRVFKRASVYVVLLIVQRKYVAAHQDPSVGFIHCKRDVGAALEDFLDGRHRRTSSYLIYEAPQASLSRPTWSVGTPEEARLHATLESLSKLNSVAVVKQGIITGLDDVFIVDADEVLADEEWIYRPLLPDRKIGRYALPKDTGKRVLYPFVEGVPISESHLETDFPATWDRLCRNRDRLSNRAPVKRGNIEWWQLAWPRRPEELLAPKIVGPQVALIPRFAIDIQGQWVVSHSPFIRPRHNKDDYETLMLLLAIMNSSITSWYISTNGRRYRGGYSMTSVSLLRRLPIPTLDDAPISLIQHLVDLTGNLVETGSELDRDLVSHLDELVVSELYGLPSDEALIFSGKAVGGTTDA